MEETTPQRLRRVSAKLFAQQGLAGTSMREIAREAGITQAAIYHHFPCKEDLYVDAVRSLQQEKMQGVSDVLALDVPPTDKFRNLVLRMLELLDADPDFCDIYHREMMEGDEERLQETVDSVYTRIMGELEPLMKAIAPDLDPTLMVMSLSGMVFHHLEVRKLIPLLPGGSDAMNALPVLADHITAVVLGGAGR